MNQNQTAALTRRKTYLAAGLVLPASCFAIGSAAAQTRAGRATVSSNAPDRIYHDYCSVCHGANGDGRGKPALTSANPPRNFRDPDFREFASGFSLFSAIAEGNGHVPAWSKTLNNQNIADVSEYVLWTLVQPRRTASGTP